MRMFFGLVMLSATALMCASKSSAQGITVYENITFVTIPCGTFQMGDISKYGDRNTNPVHTVTVDGFEMSIYEITQGQYQSIMGSNPSDHKSTDKHPVDNVSWFNAVEFCNKLSGAACLDSCYEEISWSCDFSKNRFRLPTEAEWEYACRAGTTTKYNTGDSYNDLDRAAWFDGNFDGIEHFHQVGLKEANAWGLYDMHGNVSEWCHDWWDSDYYSTSPSNNPTGAPKGSYRVTRNGRDHLAGFCRSAYRSSMNPSYTGGGLGFRVVRRP